MKKNIKELEKDLAAMKEDRDRYYTKYRELSDENARMNRSGLIERRREKEEMLNQIRNLMEIIRWQMNPSTTNSPFMPTKDQRIENRPRF